MRNSLRAVALLLAIAVVPSGCAALMSNLPAIIAGIQDGALVLSNIETALNAWFAANPNPGKQKEANIAIAKARAALDAALNIANATGDVDQGKLDAAFNEFKIAYEDVLNVAGPYGVHVGVGMRASAGETIVPTSAELMTRVRRR